MPSLISQQKSLWSTEVGDILTRIVRKAVLELWGQGGNSEKYWDLEVMSSVILTLGWMACGDRAVFYGGA